MIQPGAVQEGMCGGGGGGGWGLGDDSAHWPSRKSLFYGPHNDPPASNLRSVALQIGPVASGSQHEGAQDGWRR